MNFSFGNYNIPDNVEELELYLNKQEFMYKKTSNFIFIKKDKYHYFNDLLFYFVDNTVYYMRAIFTISWEERKRLEAELGKYHLEKHILSNNTRIYKELNIKLQTNDSTKLEVFLNDLDQKTINKMNGIIKSRDNRNNIMDFLKVTFAIIIGSL